MIVDAKKDFIAIGRLAHNQRVLVRDIEAVMQRAEMQPVMRVNGVPYLDAEQAEAIRTELRARGG